MAQEIAELHLQAEIGQKVLLTRGSEVLICRGIGDSMWDLPGGRLNKNEEPKEGLKRELREELGIETVIDAPVETLVWYGAKSGIPRFFVVYAATMANESDQLTVALDELEEVRWITESQIAELPISPEWVPILRAHIQQ